MCIMKEKRCSFEFKQVEVKMVEEMLSHLSDDTSPGIDTMEFYSKLLPRSFVVLFAIFLTVV